jgi:Tol biopolymer transport system component
LSLTEGIEFPNGWTADSREVVFTSNRDEKWGVYRQPLSGGAAQPVLVEKTQEFGFARPSPDGGWLLIQRNFSSGMLSRNTYDLLRVPMAGGPEELIARDVLGHSCAAPPLPLCAYWKKDKNELIFTSFDSQLKQRRELGHFTMDPNSTGDYQWMLSPDGAKIAILEGDSNIYLLNFQTKALQRIIVKHWSNFVGVDWTADGKGLFMCSPRKGMVLLHVDLHGNAVVLWEPGGIMGACYALASPDGKHVALPLSSNNVNVWMMENF